jgi:hypothetical protein
MKALLVAVVALLAWTDTAHGYLHFDAGNGARLKWDDRPVRWFATDRGVAGVSASEFQAALQRAFETWEDVPTASIGFQFVGFVSAEPFADDGISVLGFQFEPDLERVLGATGFVVDTTTGEIVESDVFFNSAFPWSTATAGEQNRVDLESVAVHEIGHFLGLGHSALGETEPQGDGSRRVLASGAVMFPISLGRGSTEDRALQPDDIAGVSDLYPDGDFRDSTGAVRGRVLRDGRGVQGAHVVVFHPGTGELVGGFSLGAGGEFQVAGLTPGAHVVRVEPLDDADVDSFFAVEDVDVDFQVTYHPRLFVAPAGGVGERFDVTVRPK